MPNETLQVRYKRFLTKAEEVRSLQRKRTELKAWFPIQDKTKLARLEKELDKLAKEDTEFLKSNLQSIF